MQPGSSGAGAVCDAHAATSSRDSVHLDLQLRPLRTVSLLIARYSYGVCLTHLNRIWLTFEYLRWLLLLASAAALPVALYRGFEQPMIELGGQLASKLPRSKARAHAL